MHHGDRGTAAPARRATAARVPSARRASSPPSGESSSASSGWVSGSPKRALNSTTRGPRDGEREAGVQQPANGVPRRRHLVDASGCSDLVACTSSTRPARRPRQRRVGAHAAGVGAVVAVEDALEVLGGLQRVDRPRRRRPRTARPRARRGTPRPRPARTPAAWASASSRSLGDDDALAGGQAVVLDDVRRRRTRRAPPRPPRRVVQTRGRAVGTPATAITSLAKALSPRAAPPPDGPKTAMPACADRVGDPRDQRRLRARRRRGRRRSWWRARRPLRRPSGRRRAGWRPRRSPGCRARRAPPPPPGRGRARARARARDRRCR